MASTAAAVTLAAAASLILPKRYTATASLMIELPAGSDPRAAAAVSPVYLESLKTYEHFASSDTIFLDAINHLGLRSRLPGKSIESLKKSMLGVTRPASTRVLEISATLDNAGDAQRFAKYIAEQTVALNQSIERNAARAATADAESIFNAAFGRLARAIRSREEFSNKHPLGALASEIDNMSELRFDLQRDLQEARTSLGELEARADAGASDTPGDIEAAKARISALERQDAGLAKSIQSKGAMLEHLKQRRDELDAEQGAARAETEAWKGKLNDARASTAYQGERVSILDPGIVPERPSFPNLPLNVAIAALVAAAGSISWIALRYGYEQTESERAQSEYSLVE